MQQEDHNNVKHTKTSKMNATRISQQRQRKTKISKINESQSRQKQRTFEKKKI